MTELFEITFLVSCLSASILIVLSKWRAREYLYHLMSTRRFFSKFPFDCDFCLSFWISCLLLGALLLTRYIDFELMLILVPLASAALAQKILR